MGQDYVMPTSNLLVPGYKAMYYIPPGAGSVSLSCEHGLRYPDVCEDCKKLGVNQGLSDLTRGVCAICEKSHSGI